jgi:hypothetical protein
MLGVSGYPTPAGPGALMGFRELAGIEMGELKVPKVPGVSIGIPILFAITRFPMSKTSFPLNSHLSAFFSESHHDEQAPPGPEAELVPQVHFIMKLFPSATLPQGGR